MCASITSLIILTILFSLVGCGKAIKSADKKEADSSNPLSPREIFINQTKDNGSNSDSALFQVDYVPNRTGYVEFPDDITLTSGTIADLTKVAIYYNYRGPADYMYKCEYTAFNSNIEFSDCYDKNDTLISDLDETDGTYQDEDEFIKVELTGSTNSVISIKTLFEVN